jgi:hypothetical protein
MLICSGCFKKWTEEDGCNEGIINADIEITGKGPDAITAYSDGDKMFTGDGHWLPVYGNIDNPVNRGRCNEDYVSRHWHTKKTCSCKR